MDIHFLCIINIIMIYKSDKWVQSTVLSKAGVVYSRKIHRTYD